MSTLFYRNRRLLVLVIAVAMVAGASAFSALPRLEDPHLTPRNAIVLTRLPGATAERVEALVTEKIEDELIELSEIDTLRSVSRPGISLVTIELRGEITRPEPVWSKIRSRLDDAQASLPPSAGKPELDEDRGASAYTMVYGITWERDDEPNLGLLNRLAEELKDRLLVVAGTDDVELYGEPEEEITVRADADELAALGLTADDVARAVGAADAKVAAGAVRGERVDLLIEVAGALETLDRIAAVPLREGPDGAIVRVGDVAEVARSPRAPARELAVIDGKAAVAVAVRMEPDRRVDRWAASVREVAGDYRAGLPRGVGLDLAFDQSVYTGERLESLGGNLLAGAASIVVVIFAMMGWRSALLVASALPLSVAMTLWGLLALGIPLHQMSITGLIIALGLLIDNAIVAVDEIDARRRNGMGAAEAIADSVKHLFIPLLGSTVTTVLAFMPIVLLTGNIGEFVGPIGVSVILALVSSLFVSMTVVPALTGLFGAAGEGTGRRRWWRDGIASRSLAEATRRVVLLAARRPAVGLMIAWALPVAGFLRMGDLRDQFFPTADRDQFQVQLRLPTATSIDRTRSQVARLTGRIEAGGGVERVDWFVGSSAPSVYYNMMMNEDDTPSYANAVVRAESPERAGELIRELQADLGDALPGAQVVVRAFGQGPPIEAPIELHLFGPSPERLRLLGEEVRRVLGTLPEVTQTRATLDGGSPKLRLDADEDEARLAGLDLAGVARQLQSSLEGAVGGSVLEETEELPVRVRVDGDRRSATGAVAATNLVGPTGDGWVPLPALGSIVLEPEPARIPHRDGRRCNTVLGDLEADALPAEALARFRERLRSSGFAMPAGYEMEFGGDEAEQGEAIGGLAASVNVLAVLMVATLVLSFGSFRAAALIGGVAVASVGLGALSIWVSGYPFGFMAIIGTAGLIGVALNDSIVVLAAIRGDERAAAGDPEAIAGVVLANARHVLATTLTTVAGFLPLIFGGGGFWPPLAVVIAGGVVGSTLVALIFMPAGHVLTLRIAAAARALLDGRRVGEGEAGPSPLPACWATRAG